MNSPFNTKPEKLLTVLLISFNVDEAIREKIQLPAIMFKQSINLNEIDHYKQVNVVSSFMQNHELYNEVG